MILNKDAAPNINKSDNEERAIQNENSRGDGKNEEDDSFKIKLIKWLKEKILKLVASITGDKQQNVGKNVSDQVGLRDNINKEPLGFISFKWKFLHGM